MPSSPGTSSGSPRLQLRLRDDHGERAVEVTRRVSLIGRGEACHLRLEAAGVAESHALLYLEPSGYRLVPASPGQVVLINGRATEGSALQADDEVMIGAARLQVCSLRAAPDPELAFPPDSETVAEGLLAQLEAFSKVVLAEDPWPRPAEALLQSLLQLTGAEHAFLVLCHDDHRFLVAARPQAEGDALLSDSVVERVLASGQPLIVDDASQDPGLATNPSVVALHLSAVMCMPLRLGGRVHGALYVGHSHRAGLFGPRAVAIMNVFCAQAALLLESARRMHGLRRTVEDLRGRLDQAAQDEIVGDSAELHQVLQTLARAAPVNVTILLLGQTGTGKELLARRIHRLSARAAGPFIAVNCAAIPEELLESELFGHVRGAFTGAHQDRQGLLECASGGTLFLDEIGELSPRLQPKLLRALQERRVRRLGEGSDRPVDIRIVAASNRDLASDQTFRRDLFFRLAEVVIEVPPLRARGGDLELLTRLFLRRFAAEFSRAELRLSRAAWSAVVAHEWPGNIRELENRLRRAVLLAEGSEIQPDHLGLDAEESAIELLEAARDRFVASHVRRAIAVCGGDRARAASVLGIGLRSLYRYLQQGREP